MEYFFPFTTSCDVSWWINYKITYDSKLLHRFVYYVFLDCEFSPVSSWSIIGYLDCHSSLIFYTGILFIRLHFMVLFPNIMAISRAFFLFLIYVIHFVYEAPVLEATTINGFLSIIYYLWDLTIQHCMCILQIDLFIIHLHILQSSWRLHIYPSLM